MKQWDNFWNLWQECNVPPILTKEFIIGEHSINSPWFWLVGERQVYFENPINDTAHHIAVYLSGKAEELIAAYKLYAYLRYYNRHEFMIDPIEFIMGKHDLKLYDWWHPSAKYVLPYSPNYREDYHATEKDWQNIVLHAAETWSEIAKEWAIIIIPDFMDHDSAKYKEFRDYCDKVYEKREYEKYLELKKKFENK